MQRALARIEAVVGERAGLRPPGWVLTARVRDRMHALGLAAPDGYADVLETSEGELDELLEALRVGETRFFRHRAHVGAIRRVVAPDLAARKVTERRVRAWSAGCATGEEAYTLAILLAEAMPPSAGWIVEVLGTDLSDDALAIARAGVYTRAQAELVPAPLRERMFVDHRQGVKIAREIARLVTFERRNLVDAIQPRGMDVVLCRNVLIYFDAPTQKKTALRLIDALEPGGYLFLGYAESLRQFEQLEALRTDDGMVYQKRVAKVERPTPAPVPPRPVRPSDPPPVVVAAKSVPPIRRVILSGSYEDGDRIGLELLEAVRAATVGVEVDLDGAEFLGDDVATVLRRARSAASAAGLRFDVRATRPGPRRFLSRHGFGP